MCQYGPRRGIARRSMGPSARFSWAVVLIMAWSFGCCCGQAEHVHEFSFTQPDVSCRQDYAAERCGCDAQPNLVNQDAAPEHLLILGPLKTGSNFLFNALSLHPNIRGATQKETFGFVRSGRGNTSVDLEDYMKFWGDIGDVKKDVFMEASVAYFMSKQVPCVVKRSVPHAKFIVLLRDPSARMWSFIDMIRRKCIKFQKLHNNQYACDMVFRTYAEIVAREMELLFCNGVCKFNDPENQHSWPECSLARSLETVNNIYAPQIAHWFKYFEPSQFLFLRTEDLTSDPENQVNRVLDFVGLPSSTYPFADLDNDAVFSYPGEYLWKDDTLVETQTQLARFYQKTNIELLKYLRLNGHNVSMWSQESLQSGNWNFPSGMVDYTIQGVMIHVSSWSVFQWMLVFSCAVGIGWGWFLLLRKKPSKKDAKLTW